MINTPSTEESIVRSFVDLRKQERLLELVKSSSKTKRHKFIQSLAHFDNFDSRYTKLIPTSVHDHEALCVLMRSFGAPEMAYVISEMTKIDGVEMRLADALRSVVGRGMGSIISCIPGKLAYFESEYANDCRILQR